MPLASQLVGIFLSSHHLPMVTGVNKNAEVWYETVQCFLMQDRTYLIWSASALRSAAVQILCNIDTIAMREGMQECRHFGIVWIVVNSFGLVLFDSTTYNWIPLDCFWFCWMYYPREVGWHWQFRQRAQNGHPPLPRSPSGQTGRLPAWKSSSKKKRKQVWMIKLQTSQAPTKHQIHDQNWPKPSN